MPVAPNPLLQANVIAKPARATQGASDKGLQAPAGQGKGFDQVMAKQGRDNGAVADDKIPPAKPREKADSGNKDSGDAAVVAADGNTLPAGELGESSEGAPLDASLVAGQVSDPQPGAQLIQAQAQTVAPVLQAATQQLPFAPLAPIEEPVAEAFDPDADPLAGLPTLRLALEQSAQAKGMTSAHASPTAGAGEQPGDEGRVAVNTLATLVDDADGDSGQSERGDKAFGALLDDGLKDIKGASSDTRVEDFANRLATLTQAATPKTANAVPVNPAPLHQPLAMNQGAWTEGLVNRVMYLSSQNLKSADIQLEPAELGRLDIRVNLATDQAAQITFVSGHAGVRDALDSQLHRLRELFAQQGLAQPDVNVADQSRGQQQQQAQQGAHLSGVAARRAEAQAEASQGELNEAGRPAPQQIVIGDSAVDYYA